MELLDIVDEYGNKTGKVMERDKVHELNLFHWEISVFLINNKKEVLLQKRSATKKMNPNMWGSCAGHVDSGEGLEETALREIEEEIGLKFSLDDLHVLEERQVTKKEINSHLTKVYYVYYNGNDFKLQTEEVSEVKWFNIDDVINMIKNNDESLTFKSDRLYLLENLKEKMI
ncbi:MAG: NUDIX domain-containing protein [Bacilli bacterium]|nr:NUDIX domain-containing protein [Bacilli bacterium]